MPKLNKIFLVATLSLLPLAVFAAPQPGQYTIDKSSVEVKTLQGTCDIGDGGDTPPLTFDGKQVIFTKAQQGKDINVPLNDPAGAKFDDTDENVHSFGNVTATSISDTIIQLKTDLTMDFSKIMPGEPNSHCIIQANFTKA